MTKPSQPVLVGLIRGAGGAILIALIGVLIVQLGDVKAGTLAPYVPVAALALRTIEAWVLDQRKQVADPVPAAPPDVAAIMANAVADYQRSLTAIQTIAAATTLPVFTTPTAVTPQPTLTVTNPTFTDPPPSEPPSSTAT